MADKSQPDVYAVEAYSVDGGDEVLQNNGTSNDARDMFRMGKRQQLKVCHSFRLHPAMDTR